MERERKEGHQDELERLTIAARRRVNSAIAKERRLIKNLEGDLERHGDPERWKRFGDLLLANIGTAERSGDRIFVIDYFDETTPRVEIEGDKNKALTDVAEQYFTLYTKARNGRAIIADPGPPVEALSKRVELDPRKK